MLRTVRFINTKQFSPVIYENDLPWEDDYFHLPYTSITKEFLQSGDYLIDEQWWRTQKERCVNGYTVQNAIEEGGDCFSTEILSVEVEHNGEHDTFYWGNNIEIDGDEVYFKDLGITANLKTGTVHITGRMYFYLNFWKIHKKLKNSKRKIISHPEFTDLTFMNWHIRSRSRKLSLDLMWTKARQKGLSEEEACDTAYEYLFYNDSQSVILGGIDIYNENTMKMVKNGLKRIQNTQFFKETAKGGNSEDYLQTNATGAEIYSRTCKNNDQVASGLTPSKVHFEEIGIWTKGLVSKVSENVDASLEAEGEKTGQKVFTGTGGDVEDGVADMEAMTYNPEKNNLLAFDYELENPGEVIRTTRFIPAFLFRLIDEFGNSKCRESIIDIYKYQNDKTGEERYTRTVMNPLRLSHIFMSKEGGYFGKEVSQWCNERIAYIKTHRDAQVEKRYRAELKDPKNIFAGIEMVYDEEGPFYISEMPCRDKDGNVYRNLYRAGTDSYDQNDAAYSTSKGCVAIKKGFLNANSSYNKYVAYVLERPSSAMGGAEVFFSNTTILSIFFNATNLIEFSKIRIIDWIVRHNYASILKLRPEFVTANMVIQSKATNKYGIDASTKPHWLAMHKDWLRNKENIDKCDHPELLKAWSKFRYDPSGKKFNCDVTIATSLCTVCEEDEIELTVETQETKKRFESLHYVRDNNGNLVAQIN